MLMTERERERDNYVHFFADHVTGKPADSNITYVYRQLIKIYSKLNYCLKIVSLHGISQTLLQNDCYCNRHHAYAT